MMNPDVVIYDKGRSLGGRVSGKSKDSFSYDFGATMFRDIMEVHWLGGETKYSIIEIWKSKHIQLQVKPIYDGSHFYPINGMAEIVSAMIGNVKPIQRQILKKIEVAGEETWNLEFENSETKESNTVCSHSVILTLPIPQILEIFERSEKNSKIQSWIDFLEPFNDYRKTLVSYFYWDQWKPDWKSLGLDPFSIIPITTSLDRGSDWEYQSWESLKYPNEFKEGSALLVQFGAIFSESHFEDWMEENKKPKAKYEEYFIQELKTKFGAPPPNIIWNHRWKYAQAQLPLLGREGPLQLDGANFEEWKKLCKETRITILGDWLFGSKIERIVGGIYFLNHNALL
ncbi:NAD(P)-binding Rossmann-like domain protein [Leptospira congkakensis]|uniref:NAD(P)-binding Rossmann-like domain protein n=2 Tax=Leptospira congkakensis TaxID=2484932 RepID=A0A4Z1A7J9_9LEPT|nr:NAD(P)-binding Rossmann-like domain protein [Leptospira congkakensis]TGL92003.1 NAD(P)-binding Rossmann-like domain protein [Leptospira congkakensis]TGL99049.1 NAD(P)-binding Rossmann-like domain protein [Leptospira congkakensis]